MDTEKKDPSHIRQTIKGKPLSIRNLLIRLLIVCAFAAIAAIIAAFVFVHFVPIAEKASGKVTPTPRVTIPVTEEPVTETPDLTQTPSPTPKPTASPAPKPTEEPKETEEPENNKDKEKEKEKEKDKDKEKDIDPSDKTETASLTVEEYLMLQDIMLETANEANKCVVTVTAISSQMDYFNQSVENRQQISGVIIAATEDAYYVLTESRIFNNIERIQVTFRDGFIADGIFLKGDPDTGLAVIKVGAEEIPEESAESISAASLGNSYFVKTGDPVVALGSPNGYSNSISFGKITSTDSVIPTYDCEYNLLVTDISGTKDGSGILIDFKGNVVGIIDQSFNSSDSMTVTGISISQLKTLIEQLSNGESRSYIGIKGSEVTNSVSEITGIPKGIIVTGVADDSPAFFAGLSELDVITQLGEEKVTNMTQYKNALAKIKPGKKVVLKVLRKGAEGYTEIEFEIETGEI